MTLNDARYLINAARRAASLLSDGYTIVEDSIFDGVFDVVKPDGTKYTVWADGFRHSCTCPAFEAHAECKHHIAVIRLQEDADADARFAVIAGAEHSEYGCDPGAEF